MLKANSKRKCQDKRVKERSSGLEVKRHHIVLSKSCHPKCELQNGTLLFFYFLCDGVISNIISWMEGAFNHLCCIITDDGKCDRHICS